MSNLASFIHIARYLNVRKMSEMLVFRTFVGALVSIFLKALGRVCLAGRKFRYDSIFKYLSGIFIGGTPCVASLL